MTSQQRKVFNFAAGPAKVPEEVLLHAQSELLDYQGTGISICETSHRSGTFTSLCDEAEKKIRSLLSVPDSYAVLFMHGGAVGSMASVPMNLAGSPDATVDYVVTGSWSEKAAKEAAKYCKVNVVNNTANFTAIEDPTKWKKTPNAAYLYYCDNETIHGIEFPEVPGSNVPIVCDMTSNLFTRPIDITKFGCIFAGTQKNAGISALVLVIVRKDLIKPMAITPSVFDFNVTIKNKSLQNTPPCFPIYMMNLVLDWTLKNGGTAAMSDRSMKKSQLIYDAIDSSGGFYHSPVEKRYRSRVTIPFRVGGSTGNEELEKKFLKEAEEVHRMIQLKGHRSVGGIRASMYNALTVEEATVLANFMKEFHSRHK